MTKRPTCALLWIGCSLIGAAAYWHLESAGAHVQAARRAARAVLRLDGVERLRESVERERKRSAASPLPAADTLPTHMLLDVIASECDAIGLIERTWNVEPVANPGTQNELVLTLGFEGSFASTATLIRKLGGHPSQLRVRSLTLRQRPQNPDGRLQATVVLGVHGGPASSKFRLTEVSHE